MNSKYFLVSVCLMQYFLHTYTKNSLFIRNSDFTGYHIFYLATLCKWNFLFFYILFYFVYIVFLLFILLQLSQFFPFCPPPPSQPLSPTVNPLPIVHSHESFVYALWLMPSPSFHHYPRPSSPPAAISLFHVSMPLVLFFSLVCSVC